MKRIIAGIKDFKAGYVYGIDMMEDFIKQPRWVCYIVAILSLPINIIVMIGILMFAGMKGLRDLIMNMEYIRKA